MPHKDPEKRRENNRESARRRRAANPEKYRAKAREFQRKNRAANRDKINERMREWYARNKDRVRKKNCEKSKKWHAANPEKVREGQERRRVSGAVRYSYIKCTFGLTREQYDHLFESQGGCCAICGMHFKDHFRSLSIDHNHQSGKVRGLLCSQCNIALGNFHDNIDLLKSAILYLQSPLPIP